MDENKIVIVSDNSDVIEFDDITIRHDTVSRNEVADVKAEIERLESEKVTIDERIVELKAKILYAEKVIAIADEAKAVDCVEVEPVVDDVKSDDVNDEINNEIQAPEVDE